MPSWKNLQIIAILLFGFAATMITNNSAIVLWLGLMSLALVISTVGSILKPQTTTNRWPLIILGVIFYALVLVIFYDVFDEFVLEHNDVGGGFSSGNGFLFDGIGAVAYYVVVPILAAVGAGLLTYNSYLKQNTINYKGNLDSFKHEFLPAITIVSTIFNISLAAIMLLMLVPDSFYANVKNFYLVVSSIVLGISILTSLVAEKGKKHKALGTCLVINGLILILVISLYIAIPTVSE